MTKKNCSNCKKEVDEKLGKKVLRGLFFICPACVEKVKQKTKDKEVCEFC